MKTCGALCRVAAVVAAVSVAPVAGAADDVAALKEQNAELRSRLDKLGGDLEQVKASIAAKDQQGMAKSPARLVDMQFYGMIKLDAARDDSRTSSGDFARWVESEGARKNDDQFSMTANQTRLGVLLNGPDQAGIKTSGQIEMDFYGQGAAENKPDAMLRHAFLKAEWTEWKASLLAGQTTDIISPLTAPTVNYSVCWWQGNIGYRRPQIRLTKDVDLTESVSLKVEAGVSRNITDRKFVYSGATDPDSGADSGSPAHQGRLSISFPSFNGKPATVGVSGHWGREEQRMTNALGAVVGDSDHLSWSGNADMKLPVTGWLLLQAESFFGKNLGAYLGGIGQGFDPVLKDDIAAKGGWAAATLGPWGKWQFNLGAGIDQVDSDDLAANAKAPPRLSNAVCFGNCIYSLTGNLQLALEVSRMRTTYKDAPVGDNWREQIAAIYKF